MIVTTTPSVEGRAVADYLGIVTGEVVAGANVVKDAFAGIRDLVGGRARAYEGVLRRAREEAIRSMIADAEARGADAVVGVDIDYEVLGRRSGMLMVSASGTAVRLG